MGIRDWCGCAGWQYFAASIGLSLSVTWLPSARRWLDADFYLPLRWCSSKHAPIFDPFGLPFNRFIRLLFSVEIIFFSYNNSVRTVFSASFNQVSANRTGPFVDNRFGTRLVAWSWYYHIQWPNLIHFYPSNLYFIININDDWIVEFVRWERRRLMVMVKFRDQRVIDGEVLKGR